MAIKNHKTGEIKYAGLVLHSRGSFQMDTSTDIVLIWDPVKQTTHIETLWTPCDWYADVDASDEIKAEYYQSIRDRQTQLDARNADNRLKSVQVGSRIKVVRGRGLAKGTIGVVERIYASDKYTTIYLVGGSKTYLTNVLVEYQGNYIEPQSYYEAKVYFQAV